MAYKLAAHVDNPIEQNIGYSDLTVHITVIDYFLMILQIHPKNVNAIRTLSFTNIRSDHG